MEEQRTEPAPLPGSAYLSENGATLELERLHGLKHPDLLDLAREFSLRVSHERTRHQLVFDLLKAYAARGVTLVAEGMVEISNESYGFLRWELYNFVPCPEDVYVSANLLKRHGLRPGHKVRGILRAPRDKEKFMALEQVLSIEGIPLDRWGEP